MDYIKALTFMWEDPRWKEKIAMGTVVVLISMALMPVLIGVVGIIILMGYGLRLLENVRDGNQYPLPEWDQWSDDLSRGFKLFVVSFVWGLPAMLLALPIAFGGILAAAGTDGNSAGPLAAIGGLSMAFGYCLILIYGIFYYLITPGFTIWVARNEQISEGFKFTEIWAWTRKNLGNVIIVMIAIFIASMVITTVASIVGAMLCIVGLIVTVPLGVLATYLYQYHLIGQLAYKDLTGASYYVPAAPVPPMTPVTPVTPAPQTPPAPAAPTGPVTPESGSQPTPPDQPQALG
jgi:hypothetical protein